MEVADDKDARTVAEVLELRAELKVEGYTDRECRRWCRPVDGMRRLRPNAAGDWDMRQQAIKDEASKLVSEFDSGAYEKAREAMREARRRKNMRLERYFAKVAVTIASQTGKRIGEDTATRLVGVRVR
jgi:hypothetical protein